MRWSLEQQLTNVETRIKELQKRKKMLLAKTAEVEQQKEQKSLKELYAVLQKNGITPDQYAVLVEKIKKK
jgi:hypothetical protein